MALAAPREALAFTREERVLSFFHTHTSERLTVPYFADGDYLPGGLARLDRFLSDFRTGEEQRSTPGCSTSSIASGRRRGRRAPST